MKKIEIEKKKLGASLKKIRIKNEIRPIDLLYSGINHKLMQSIENGGGYTIDKLFLYCDAIGCEGIMPIIANTEQNIVEKQKN